jgi:MtaA/CmuA family methyltransferase
MMDFYDDPDFIRHLADFAVGMASSYAAAQIEAGADIIGVGDAAASLLSRELYDQFIWPAEKRLVDRIHELGGRVRLHICGNTSHLLDAIGALGVDLVDLDYPVDLAVARAKMGPAQVLSGNLHPVQVVKQGTPAGITAALQSCEAAAGPWWAIAAGCEIPRGTPEENVIALTRFGPRANLAGGR